MAYGIQLLTSDGQKTTLDFKAGRYVGSSTEENIKTAVDHIPPAGVVLADPDLMVFPAFNFYFYWAHYYLINAVSNVIEIRTRANASYDPSSPGSEITFHYLRFQ